MSEKIAENEEPGFVFQPDESDIRYVYTVAFRLTADPAGAEDLAQETLLKAWRTRSRLREPRARKSWLRTICLRLHLSMRRKKGIIVEVLPGDDLDGDSRWADLSIPEPADVLATDEAVRLLRDGCFTAMANRLPEGQRAAFLLADVFGTDLAEASELLGLSLNAFKALLHRARKNMNAFFGPHCSHILPHNPCSCRAWLEFQGDREKLREQLKKEGGTPDFSSPSYGERGSEETAGRVLSLFRNLPERKPPREWYDRVVGELLSLRR